MTHTTHTEKVSISGTALSFLLYECLNSSSSQEGFLLGEVTSEITNHISDSHSDIARLDTQIIVRTVLPLPLVSLFYSPTGRIKEDILTDLLLEHLSEVVGWYKYRSNSIKPTLRDKLISKGLQKYFKKHHDKKTFTTCNVSTRLSSGGSTHTFIYRFGKVNCFGMYEYIEDVTANLGEKLTGYKKGLKLSPHSIFNNIVQESNVSCNDSSEAILKIQQAVDIRLVIEAQIAANTECSIQDLAVEIKKMIEILAGKQMADLQDSHKKNIDNKLKDRNQEMVQACVNALKTQASTATLNDHNILMVTGILDNNVNLGSSEAPDSSSSPSTSVMKPLELNYSRAVKKKEKVKKSEKPSPSNQENCSKDLNVDVRTGGAETEREQEE